MTSKPINPRRPSMLPPSHQKNGTRMYRRREARRLRRDRKIYRNILQLVNVAEHLHALAGEPIEYLSVYSVDPDRHIPHNPSPGWIPKLTLFPITEQENGRPIPQWEDLSQWMKVQVVPMAYRGEFLTFNVRIHPDLEDRWVASGADIRKKMVERIRKELDEALGKQREFFFVIEGWSKVTKAPTYLHIHGGAAIREPSERPLIEQAVGRAAGHGLTGFAKIPRAIDSELFHVEQAAYATYLLKAAHRPDPRLKDRRLSMSHSLTYVTRIFWELITRDPLKWKYPC
jgi:hypothetical protein